METQEFHITGTLTTRHHYEIVSRFYLAKGITYAVDKYKAYCRDIAGELFVNVKIHTIEVQD